MYICNPLNSAQNAILGCIVSLNFLKYGSGAYNVMIVNIVNYSTESVTLFNFHVRVLD